MATPAKPTTPAADSQLLTGHEPCPKCGASLPVYDGYKTWCDQCLWNLDVPAENPAPRTLFQRLYASLSKSTGQQLFDSVIAAPPEIGQMTHAKIAAYAIAAGVHLATLAIVGFAFWLIFFSFPTVRLFGVIVGIGCLVWVLLLLIPRLPRPAGTPLPRADYPALYGLADRIAVALGSPPVDQITYVMNYHANFSRYGWKRTPVMVLGLPLISCLDGQELAALIAHELAHGVSGDPERTLFLGGAWQAVGAWYEAISPGRRWNEDMGKGMFASMLLVLNILTLPIAGLLWLVSYALAHLLWHDKQRAEYLADWLAAQTAGVDAQLAMLGKIQLQTTYETVLRFSYLDRQSGTFFAILKRRIGKVPPRELERLRLIEEKSGARVDYSHPSAGQRIAFLKAHRIAEPRVVVSTDEIDAIGRELAPLQESLQKWIMSLDSIAFRETFQIKL